MGEGVGLLASHFKVLRQSFLMLWAGQCQASFPVWGHVFVWHFKSYQRFAFLSAIKVFPSNLKAYYRQALALKHQKRYLDAVQAAQRGQKIQPISVSTSFKTVTIYVIQ